MNDTMGTDRSRACLFLLALVLLLSLCASLGGSTWIHERRVLRAIGFALLVPTGLLVALLFPRGGSPGFQRCLLLAVALVTRLLLFAHPPDSDVHRYLWEGRLVREGQSPYSQVANASEREALRDRYWQGMNQREHRTVYPPVAEWIFAAAGAMAYDPLALKVVFLAFDFGVLALLFAATAARGRPPWMVGFYAFNPVPLVGFAGEAHFDAMMLFFVLVALRLQEDRRPAWSWLALAVAVQVKVVAVVLVPIFLRRRGWRSAWVGALAASAPFLPYVDDASNWFEGLRHFGADLAFNGSIHAILQAAFGNQSLAAAICGLLLVGWSIRIARVEEDSWRAAFLTLGGLLVLLPTVHYWYASWALVFLPLFPSLAWLTLSGSMAFYFLLGDRGGAGGPGGRFPGSSGPSGCPLGSFCFVKSRSRYRGRGQGRSAACCRRRPAASPWWFPC